MNYLPKNYPAFIKLLVSIAEKGNDYKGSDMLPLARTDKEKLGLVIFDIQDWCERNIDLIKWVGLNYNPPKTAKIPYFKTSAK